MRNGLLNWIVQALVRRCRLAVVLSMLLACLLPGAIPTFSQRMRSPTGAGRRFERMPMRQTMRRPVARRPAFFERLRDLPPAEQERVLKNDKRFRKLSPERQQEIRDNLQRWNYLSPEQKQEVRQREKVYSQLTPEQRQNVREMAGEWQNLRPAEKQRVRQALRRMRGMTPEERQKFLESPQFSQGFSPQEQNILRGLGRLFPRGDGPDR